MQFKRKIILVVLFLLVLLVLMYIINEVIAFGKGVQADVYRNAEIPSEDSFKSGMNYQLMIDSENMRVLAMCREKALSQGTLLDSNQPSVQGKLTVGLSEYDVKVRLKGALKSHWKPKNRWSYRIVVKNGYCMENGLKVFSIQSGKMRGDLVEHYYHHYLEMMGLIHLKYANINFRMNDRFFKNYVIEEFFDTPLLEKSNRLEGPILKFVFDEYWSSLNWLDSNLTTKTILDRHERIYETAPIKCFNLKSNKSDKTLNEIGVAKLEGFRAGEYTTNDVFDVKLLANYFAVNTLFGSQHPAYLTNLRFYYNPTSNLLEPIGYDLEVVNDLKLANNERVDENYWPNKEAAPKFTAQLFMDTTLQREYAESLRFITDSIKIDDLNNVFANELYYYKKLNGKYHNDYLDLLKSNQAIIKSVN